MPIFQCTTQAAGDASRMAHRRWLALNSLFFADFYSLRARINCWEHDTLLKDLTTKNFSRSTINSVAVEPDCSWVCNSVATAVEFHSEAGKSQ